MGNRYDDDDYDNNYDSNREYDNHSIEVILITMKMILVTIINNMFLT